MAIYGIKVGMTRWIDSENGSVHAVTVLECEPNRITGLVKDGSESVKQVTFGKVSTKQLNKPELGLFRKLEIEPGKHLAEVKLSNKADVDKKIGDTLTVASFKDVDFVDIVGTTVGKGFAGCVKRHNFKMQDATHGNSLSHRAPGSIGQCQDPGRVFKGKKMAGRMGGVQRTARNLELLHVDTEKNLVIVKGAVPGHKGGLVEVKAANKKKSG